VCVCVCEWACMHYGSGMFRGWGAAAEAKAIGEHQLEGGLVTTRDTIAQGYWCIRVGDYEDMVKEARPLKHIYLTMSTLRTALCFLLNANGGES